MLCFIPLNKRIETKHSTLVCVCIFVADADMMVMSGFDGCCALSDLPCVDFASLIDSAELLSGLSAKAMSE